MSNHPNRCYTPAFRAAELGAILARHYPDAPPHWIAEVVGDMQRATRARRQDAAEMRINLRLARSRLGPVEMPPSPGGDDQVDGDGYARHAAPAHVNLGGDPRGACGFLFVPGHSSGHWGGGFPL